MFVKNKIITWAIIGILGYISYKYWLKPKLAGSSIYKQLKSGL